MAGLIIDGYRFLHGLSKPTSMNRIRTKICLDCRVRVLWPFSLVGMHASICCGQNTVKGLCSASHTDCNSDTTASAFTFIFYRLTQEPAVVETLRQELDEVEDIRSDQMLQSLPYLTGVIHKVLRLHPPVPGGFPRQTPRGGFSTDGHYTSGEVTCVALNYSIARCQHPCTRSCSLVVLMDHSGGILRGCRIVQAGALGCIFKHEDVQSGICSILPRYDHPHRLS